MYYNTSDPNGSYTTYGTTPESDYMLVIIQGAQASTAVMQVEVAY